MMTDTTARLALMPVGILAVRYLLLWVMRLKRDYQNKRANRHQQYVTQPLIPYQQQYDRRNEPDNDH